MLVFVLCCVGNIISELDFQDITVGDALRILAKQSDLNFISSKDAAKVEMTLFLRDIKPMEVLDAMAKTYNLWYQQDKKSNVIRIYTVKEFRLGKVDYRNERTEIFTFKHRRTSLDFAYMVRDLFGYQRVVLSQGADENEIINDLNDRMERFDIIARNTFNQSSGGDNSGFGLNNSGGGNNGQNGNNQNGNNQNSNNRNGNNQNGGNSQNNFGGNNQNNRQGRQMRLQRNQALDITNMLPEGELGAMLSGSHNLSAGVMDLLIEHISPIYVTLIRRQNRVLIRTRDKDAMKDIQGLFKQLDIEMATLLLEVKVLELDLNDGYESSFEFNFKSGNAQVTKANNESFLNSVSDVTDLVRTGLGDPSMVAAIVSKNFDARLKLLEDEGRVTALATPMLTTTNQEVSRIFIGEERPITTSISVECPNLASVTSGTGIIGTPATQSVCVQDPQTDIRSIGKTLLLTPNINANGTVDIRILVEDSSVCAGCGTIPAQSSGGEIVNYNVDTVNTQTFSGNIIAENTQMIAVGGLINERSVDVEKKVPILGDIPYLGFFFSDTQKRRKRTEMVILIRPYVMNNNQDTPDVNQSWLQGNSIHPSADKLNHLDIYKNADHLDKGYELQPDYKVYRGQDRFDGFHEQGVGAIAPKVVEPAQVSNKQKVYTQLTEYAAQAVRLPASERKIVAGIQAVSLARQRADILYDTRLTAVSAASWRRGGVYVTAIEVRNLSNETVAIDYRHIKGNWLASSIEQEKVAPRKVSGDTTYLYLISSMPFEEALEY